jgi:UDP-glucose 4-epimerase
MFSMDIRKRPAENVFRKHNPDAVVHMATVTHFQRSGEQRYRINLNGTRAVFDHAAKYGVGHVLFVGRHTYYGAAPDSPLYHTEADPPLAVATFPDLADLVAADLYAGAALWRHPEMCTTVLRFVYTLGPTRRGTLATFLKGPRVPCVSGFDPLFHFMHDEDVVDAISVTLTQRVRGVFNVTGPPPVPVSLLIKRTGRTQVSLPEVILKRVLGRFGLPKLPVGALTHLKFPLVIDGDYFRRTTGFEHRFDEDATMDSFRWA